MVTVTRKIGKHRCRGRDILDEIGAYQTGKQLEYSGSRSRPCRLTLGSVGNGALGAKPGSETFDCASPISVLSHPPALSPPPLDPATSTLPPNLVPGFHSPRHDGIAVLYHREAYLLADASPSSLSSWNELQIRYSYRVQWYAG